MWSEAKLCQPSEALIGARVRPPAFRWSIAMTRYSPANSVVGFTGEAGRLQKDIVESKPPGAKVRMGNPWPYSS
jgi:hypothetical protein